MSEDTTSVGTTDTTDTAAGNGAAGSAGSGGTPSAAPSQASLPVPVSQARALFDQFAQGFDAMMAAEPWQKSAPSKKREDDDGPVAPPFAGVKPAEIPTDIAWDHRIDDRMRREAAGHSEVMRKRNEDMAADRAWRMAAEKEHQAEQQGAAQHDREEKSGLSMSR